MIETDIIHVYNPELHADVVSCVRSLSMCLTSLCAVCESGTSIKEGSPVALTFQDQCCFQASAGHFQNRNVQKLECIGIDRFCTGKC